MSALSENRFWYAMLERRVVGEVPAKHHLALRGPDSALRYEHCLTRQGFDGPYTIAYRLQRPHLHQPSALPFQLVAPVASADQPLQKRHLRSTALPAGGTVWEASLPLLFSDDVVLSCPRPTSSDAHYLSNADADDLYFIQQGGGVLRSELGDVAFEKNDYLCVPKGTLHRFVLDENKDQHWFRMECLGGMGLLPQWRNEVGQLRMDAPYCHRDFRLPAFVGPLDEGMRTVLVKREHKLHAFEVPHSPLDVVGYDGSVYPWVFPILNFQPRAGLVHLPPDWHGTFRTRGALICSFVPRMVDFHEQAIPCPYPHASVDCDEVLFYVSGNFTSRKGVGPGSLSFHPKGLSHGPHPGAYEASIGSQRTDELAVMLDTFKPLQVTRHAEGIDDPDYMRGFL